MVLSLLTPRIRRPWVISLNQTPPRVFEIPLYFWQCNYHNRRAARKCRTCKFPAHDQKGAKLVLQQPALFVGARCLTWERHRGQFHWKPLGDSTGERQRVANSSQRRAAHQAGAEDNMDSGFAGCALPTLVSGMPEDIRYYITNNGGCISNLKFLGIAVFSFQAGEKTMFVLFLPTL